MNTIIFADTRSPHEESAEHFHKQFEIILCSTAGVIHTAKEDVSYSAGDCLCIPPLMRHQRSEAGERDIDLLLDRALLPFREIKRLPCEDALRQASESALAEMKGQRDEAVLEALGNLIVSLLTRGIRAERLSPVVQTLKNDIDTHLSSADFSLENAIRALPLNYDYVRKLFRKEIGATPLDYLTAERMKLARAVIFSGMNNAYSPYSVAQIAEMCGFTDPLYFSRVFKKAYGVSPSDCMDLRQKQSL